MLRGLFHLHKRLLVNPQILLQLKGVELAHAQELLQQGRVGLEVVDFAHPALLDTGWENRLAELLPLCQSWPGPLSMHGPFLDLSPASPDPGLRRLTLHRYRQAIAIGAQLQASYLVFHSQFNPSIREANYATNWVAGNANFWATLLPELEAVGTTALIENVWEPGPDHIIALLDRVNSPYLRSCLDVAHAHLYGKLPVSEWVTRLGKRLAYVHLSDNQGQWDDHLPLGLGEINFQPLIATIAKLDVTPWFVLEVNSLQGAKQSLQHLGWEID